MISFLVKQGGLPYCYVDIIDDFAYHSTPFFTFLYDKLTHIGNKLRLPMIYPLY